MIYIAKKEQETSAALVRRFMQRIQASGVLKEAKSRKYYKKPVNRNMRRVDALEREKKRTDQIRLKKYGKGAYK